MTEENPWCFEASELPYRALHVTRHTSQVSRYWRTLILESPTIWAGVIDLELFRPSLENWREEVFRRCGRCLLSVKGLSSFERKSLISQEFIDKDALIKFFDTYWDQIKDLHVEVTYANLVDDETWLRILSRPARFLYSFNLQLQFYDDAIHQLFPSSHNPDAALFSSVAPALRRFYLDRTTSIMALQAPWLSQLRALELNLTRTQTPRATIQILDLLENLHVLEVLKIATDYSPLSPGTDKHIRQIELPRLHRLGIDCSLDDCIYFLEHITSHQKCTLSLYPKSITIFEPPDEKCNEKIALLAEHFTIYAKALNCHDAQVLSLRVSGGSFEFTIYGKSWKNNSGVLDSSDNFLIKLQVDIRNYNFPSTIDFLPISRSVPSSLLASLKIFDLDFSSGPLQFQIFLASLLSVETLITSNDTIVHLLECSSNSTTAIFPSLHTLQIRQLEILGGFTPHGIKDFLQWRKETDRAIEILDLTIAFDAFDHIDEFGFLEEMTGLTVRWKYWDEIHEYVCGTGSSQAVLDRLRELLYMECVGILFDPDDLPDDR